MILFSHSIEKSKCFIERLGSLLYNVCIRSVLTYAIILNVCHILKFQSHLYSSFPHAHLFERSFELNCQCLPEYRYSQDYQHDLQLVQTVIQHILFFILLC